MRRQTAIEWAATGLRISEATHLVLGDVATDGLVIRKTKFGRSQLVPLHQTTAAALERYLEQRQAVGDSDDHLFISRNRRSPVRWSTARFAIY